VNNETFYASAATVIPLLLIAVMATRALRTGEFSHQPRMTLLVFGLPVIGEMAAFAYLFFEPLPAPAAAVLGLATWAGLISQLGLAAWWLSELVRREGHAPRMAGRAEQHAAPAQCPYCGGLGRVRGVQCPMCSGSGRFDQPAAAAEPEAAQDDPQQALPAAAEAGSPAEDASTTGSSSSAPYASPGILAKVTGALRRTTCPLCGARLSEGATFCPQCCGKIELPSS
jgi:hypothetical protein